jgi:hypothetical protein
MPSRVAALSRSSCRRRRCYSNVDKMMHACYVRHTYGVWVSMRTHTACALQRHDCANNGPAQFLRVFYNATSVYCNTLLNSMYAQTKFTVFITQSSRALYFTISSCSAIYICAYLSNVSIISSTLLLSLSLSMHTGCSCFEGSSSLCLTLLLRQRNNTVYTSAKTEVSYRCSNYYSITHTQAPAHTMLHCKLQSSGCALCSMLHNRD